MDSNGGNGTNKWGGNLSIGRSKPIYNRDETGKVTGYSTTDAKVEQGPDGQWYAIPTIVDGARLKGINILDEFVNSGRYWGKAATKEDAERIAAEVNAEEAKVGAPAWRNYVLDNWDDIADKVRDDDALRHEYEMRKVKPTPKPIDYSMWDGVSFGTTSGMGEMDVGKIVRNPDIINELNTEDCEMFCGIIEEMCGPNLLKYHKTLDKGGVTLPGTVENTDGTYGFGPRMKLGLLIDQCRMISAIASECTDLRIVYADRVAIGLGVDKDRYNSLGTQEKARLIEKNTPMWEYLKGKAGNAWEWTKGMVEEGFIRAYSGDEYAEGMERWDWSDTESEYHENVLDEAIANAVKSLGLATKEQLPTYIRAIKGGRLSINGDEFRITGNTVELMQGGDTERALRIVSAYENSVMNVANAYNSFVIQSMEAENPAVKDGIAKVLAGKSLNEILDEDYMPQFRAFAGKRASDMSDEERDKARRIEADFAMLCQAVSLLDRRRGAEGGGALATSLNIINAGASEVVDVAIKSGEAYGSLYRMAKSACGDVSREDEFYEWAVLMANAGDSFLPIYADGAIDDIGQAAAGLYGFGAATKIARGAMLLKGASSASYAFGHASKILGKMSLAKKAYKTGKKFQKAAFAVGGGDVAIGDGAVAGYRMVAPPTVEGEKAIAKWAKKNGAVKIEGAWYVPNKIRVKNARDFHRRKYEALERRQEAMANALSSGAMTVDKAAFDAAKTELDAISADLNKIASEDLGGLYNHVSGWANAIANEAPMLMTVFASGVEKSIEASAYNALEEKPFIDKDGNARTLTEIDREAFSIGNAYALVDGANGAAWLMHFPAWFNSLRFGKIGSSAAQNAARKMHETVNTMFASGEYDAVKATMAILKRDLLTFMHNAAHGGAIGVGMTATGSLVRNAESIAQKRAKDPSYVPSVEDYLLQPEQAMESLKEGMGMMLGTGLISAGSGLAHGRIPGVEQRREANNLVEIGKANVDAWAIAAGLSAKKGRSPLTKEQMSQDPETLAAQIRDNVAMRDANAFKLRSYTVDAMRDRISLEASKKAGELSNDEYFAKLNDLHNRLSSEQGEDYARIMDGIMDAVARQSARLSEYGTEYAVRKLMKEDAVRNADEITDMDIANAVSKTLGVDARVDSDTETGKKTLTLSWGEGEDRKSFSVGLSKRDISSVIDESGKYLKSWVEDVLLAFEKKSGIFKSDKYDKLREIFNGLDDGQRKRLLEGEDVSGILGEIYNVVGGLAGEFRNGEISVNSGAGGTTTSTIPHEAGHAFLEQMRKSGLITPEIDAGLAKVYGSMKGASATQWEEAFLSDLQTGFEVWDMHRKSIGAQLELAKEKGIAIGNEAGGFVEKLKGLFSTKPTAYAHREASFKTGDSDRPQSIAEQIDALVEKAKGMNVTPEQAAENEKAGRDIARAAFFKASTFLDYIKDKNPGDYDTQKAILDKAREYSSEYNDSDRVGYGSQNFMIRDPDTGIMKRIVPADNVLYNYILKFAKQRGGISKISLSDLRKEVLNYLQTGNIPESERFDIESVFTILDMLNHTEAAKRNNGKAPDLNIEIVHDKNLVPANYFGLTKPGAGTSPATISIYIPNIEKYLSRGTVAVDPDRLRAEVLDTFAHEFQHYVQTLEGTSKGGSDKYVAVSASLAKLRLASELIDAARIVRRTPGGDYVGKVLKQMARRLAPRFFDYIHNHVNVIKDKAARKHLPSLNPNDVEIPNMAAWDVDTTRLFSHFESVYPHIGDIASAIEYRMQGNIISKSHADSSYQLNRIVSLMAAATARRLQLRKGLTTKEIDDICKSFAAVWYMAHIIMHLTPTKIAKMGSRGGGGSYFANLVYGIQDADTVYSAYSSIIGEHEARKNGILEEKGVYADIDSEMYTRGTPLPIHIPRKGIDIDGMLSGDLSDTVRRSEKHAPAMAMLDEAKALWEELDAKNSKVAPRANVIGMHGLARILGPDINKASDAISTAIRDAIAKADRGTRPGLRSSRTAELNKALGVVKVGGFIVHAGGGDKDIKPRLEYAGKAIRMPYALLPRLKSGEEVKVAEAVKDDPTLCKAYPEIENARVVLADDPSLSDKNRPVFGETNEAFLPNQAGDIVVDASRAASVHSSTAVKSLTRAIVGLIQQQEGWERRITESAKRVSEAKGYDGRFHGNEMEFSLVDPRLFSAEGIGVLVEKAIRRRLNKSKTFTLSPEEIDRRVERSVKAVADAVAASVRDYVGEREALFLAKRFGKDENELEDYSDVGKAFENSLSLHGDGKTSQDRTREVTAYYRNVISKAIDKVLWPTTGRNREDEFTLLGDYIVDEIRGARFDMVCKNIQQGMREARTDKEAKAAFGSGEVDSANDKVFANILPRLAKWYYDEMSAFASRTNAEKAAAGKSRESIRKELIDMLHELGVLQGEFSDALAGRYERKILEYIINHRNEMEGEAGEEEDARGGVAGLRSAEDYLRRAATLRILDSRARGHLNNDNLAGWAEKAARDCGIARSDEDAKVAGKRILDAATDEARVADRLLVEKFGRKANALTAKFGGKANRYGLEDSSGFWKAITSMNEAFTIGFGKGAQAARAETEAGKAAEMERIKRMKAESGFGVDGLDKLTGYDVIALLFNPPNAVKGKDWFAKQVMDAIAKGLLAQDRFKGLTAADLDKNPEARVAYARTVARLLRSGAKGLAHGQVRENMEKAAARIEMRNPTLAQLHLSLNRCATAMSQAFDKMHVEGLLKEIGKRLGKVTGGSAKEYDALEKKRIAPRMRQYWEFVRKAMNMTPAEVDKRLSAFGDIIASEDAKALDRFLEEGLDEADARKLPTDPYLRRDVAMMRYNALTKYGAMKSKTAGECLSIYYNSILPELNGALDEHIAKVEERMKAANAVKADIIGALKPHMVDGRLSKPSAWRRFAAWNIPNLFERMRLVFKRGSKAYDMFDAMARDVSAAHIAEAKAYSGWIKELHEAVGKIYGMKYEDAISVLLEKRPELTRFSRTGWAKAKGADKAAPGVDITRLPTQLSIANLIYIYAACRQEDMAENNEVYGRDERYFAEIEKVIGPKGVSLANWMVNRFAGIRDAISPVCEDLTGVAIRSPSSSYFPLRFVTDGIAPEVSVKKLSLSPTFLHIRNHGPEAVLDEKCDVFGMFDERAKAAARYGAFARLADMVKLTFLDKNVVAAYRNVYGKGMADDMMSQLIDTVALDAHSANHDNTIGSLRAFTSATVLSFGIRSAIKQLEGVAAWGLYGGVRGYVEACMRMAVDPNGMKANAKELEDSGVFATRLVDGISHQARAQRRGAALISEKKAIPKWVRKAAGKYVRAGMWLLENVDMVASRSLAWNYYATRKEWWKGQGLSEDEARNRAISEVDYAIQITQQSARPEFSHTLQRKGELGKAITQFAGPKFVRSGEVLNSLYRLFAMGDKAAGRELAKQCIVLWAICPAMLAMGDAAWAALTGDDKETMPDAFVESYVKSVLASPLSGLFLTGTVFEHFADRSAKEFFGIKRKTYDRLSVPMMRKVETIARNLSKMGVDVISLLGSNPVKAIENLGEDVIKMIRILFPVTQIVIPKKMKITLPRGEGDAFAPMDSTPIDSTPMDSTPMDSTFVDSTPMDSTPMDSTFVDSTPMDSTFVDSTPMDSTPIDSTPMDSTPMDSTFVE